MEKKKAAPKRSKLGKQAEEALRETELLKSIFENAPIGFYRTTPDGKILSYR